MILRNKKPFFDLLKTRLAPWIISAIILLAGLIVTAYLWRYEQQHQADNLQFG